MMTCQELLGEDLEDEADEIEEDSFPALSAQAAHIRNRMQDLLDLEGGYDANELEALRDQKVVNLRKVMAAFIERETKFVQEHYD